MNQQYLKKYLANSCTPAEAEEVRTWFKTEEGQAWLQKKLEQDDEMLADGSIRLLMPDIPSKKMWDAIEAGMEENKKETFHPRRRKATYGQVAAVVLILIISSIFYVQNQMPADETVKPAQPMHYITEVGEQQKLVLRDGTLIRLNSSTQLWISGTYGEPTREVTLQGEAYFEVTHDEKKPFVIHTAGASIKDLGTAFNVRALPGEDNVQVAVTEGKVLMRDEDQSKAEATQLVQGQFGYLDLDANKIAVSTFGVHNYLSWMNGRLRFEGAPLHKVSKQLSRIYPVTFAYSDDVLRGLSLSADFERESLEATLEVIALTLRIDYRREDNQIIWVSDDQGVS